MIGIVIVNYNSFRDTLNCVSSIRTTYTGSYKIYVVDNDSTNESYNVLKSEFEDDSDIMLTKSDFNGGFSYGNNIGFRLAIQDGCDYILCSNSDIIFSGSAIRLMEKSLADDEKCGVVGPKVYCDNGELQDVIFGDLTPSIFVMIRKPFRFFDIHKKVRKYLYSDYDYSYPLKPEGMVSGCCFMIKSSLLEKIGYFDENVFLYHEENIIGKKVKKEGYYVLLNPDSEVIHLGGRSTGRVSAFTRYHKAISGLYYLWRYTNATKRQIRNVYMVLSLMFFLKGIGDKSYRNYRKQLKASYKSTICKEKVCE